MNQATPIGIIGVGLVGSVLAARLSEAGYTIVGFDPQPKVSLTSVRFAQSATAVCQSCETIFLSLPHSGIVDTVLEEIKETLNPSHLLIDTTTGDPEDALAHAHILTTRGAAFIKATIAGSSDLLRKREAGLFLGGTSQAIDRAKPLFDHLSENHFHLGEVGAASRFKLVFNLVLGLHRAVLAGALHFGESLGFDPAQTLHVLMGSPAASQR